MLRPGHPARLAGWLIVAAATTAFLWLLRATLHEAHFALAFLLLVLLASARDGRATGLVLSVVCFLAFNFLFLPPYYTLHVAEPLDWTVLASFLVTALVAAQLFHRQQTALRIAEERAVEIDRLAADRVKLSEEAQHAAALREADKLKDAMLASVSHDLRTPLTSIRATAHELRLEGEPRGGLIEEEATRLNRLVANLLDLSQVRSGTLPLTIEVNAAEDLVGAALQQLAGTPGADGIRVELPVDGSIPMGRFDFVHTLRALTNLLQNALKHSPERGTVELRVAANEAWLAFDVMDRGDGVPVGDRERLFEPYFRSASSAGVQGTGLGLAIASSIARTQHGYVSYEPRPGGGSIFSLRVPAAETASPIDS